MSEDELYEMEQMWREGVPARKIAERMGYAYQYVLRVATNHRERFPYRVRKVDEKKMAMWVERIMSGRATYQQATRALGVCKRTIEVRVQRREAELWGGLTGLSSASAPGTQGSGSGAA